jgi:hypothetical protein
MSQLEAALRRSGWTELMELEASINQALDLACQVGFEVGWTAKG